MDRKEAIRNYIKNDIMRNRNANLKDDEDLISSGILDSLAILQLVAFIENELGVRIPDEEVVYDHFMSINNLDDFLKQF